MEAREKDLMSQASEQAEGRCSALRDSIWACICPDCDGSGILGVDKGGRLHACEACGGHEDAAGNGLADNVAETLQAALAGADCSACPSTTLHQLDREAPHEP